MPPTSTARRLHSSSTDGLPNSLNFLRQNLLPTSATCPKFLHHPRIGPSSAVASSSHLSPTITFITPPNSSFCRQLRMGVGLQLEEPELAASNSWFDGPCLSITKRSGIVTRHRLVLQRHHIDGGREYAEFGHLPMKRFTDFDSSFETC